MEHLQIDTSSEGFKKSNVLVLHLREEPFQVSHLVRSNLIQLVTKLNAKTNATADGIVQDATELL